MVCIESESPYEIPNGMSSVERERRDPAFVPFEVEASDTARDRGAVESGCASLTA